MKKQIMWFLWNECDLYAGFAPRRFVACAYILHLMGCDYWYSSADYQESRQT
jgi:hypothetical protein